MRKVIFPILVCIMILVSVSCKNKPRYKGFYSRSYPFAGFTLSIDNSFQLNEYFGDTLWGVGYLRFVDSAKTEGGRRIPGHAPNAQDTSNVNEKALVRNPGYLSLTILRRGMWDLNGPSVIELIRKDTPVKYDAASVTDSLFKQRTFDASWRSWRYDGDTLSATEVIKDGKRFLKIRKGGDRTIYYAGMVGDYWLQARFPETGKDSVLLEKMWEQSSFKK